METQSYTENDWSSGDGAVIGHDAVKVSWTILLSVIVVTLIAVYLGFVRPASLQLATMQRQVTRLERSIQKLTGEVATAERAINLMDLLAEQGRRCTSASTALDQIDHLQRELVARAEGMQDVLVAADQLERLRLEIERQGELIADATRALTESNRLQQRLVQARERTLTAERAVDTLESFRQSLLNSIARFEETSPVVAQFHELCQGLLDAQPLADEAAEVSDALVTLQEDLVCQGRGVEAARSTLTQLIEMRHQIDAQTSDLPKSQHRLQQLVQLKDSVLRQTEDVVRAVETLELVSDLRHDYEDAVKAFSDIRAMMVDIVLFRPTVEQAVQTLAPITELGNLRRLSADELRRVVQDLRMRHDRGLAEDTTAGNRQGVDDVGQQVEEVATAPQGAGEAR